MRAASHDAAGAFSYGQALKAGVTVALTVAVVVSLASVLYVTVLSPDFSAKMIAEAAAATRSANGSAAEIAASEAAAAREFSAGAQALMPLVAQFVAGSIFSLILAAVFRRKD